MLRMDVYCPFYSRLYPFGWSTRCRNHTHKSHGNGMEIQLPQTLGFRVQGSGFSFRVWGLRIRVQDLNYLEVGGG
jgi:hypothetical protein